MSETKEEAGAGAPTQEATGQDIFALAAKVKASRALLAEAIGVFPGLFEAVHYLRNNAMDMERDHPDVVKAEASARELVTKIRSAS